LFVSRHPDKNKDSNAETKFVEVTQAYEVSCIIHCVLYNTYRYKYTYICISVVYCRESGLMYSTYTSYVYNCYVNIQPIGYFFFFLHDIYILIHNKSKENYERGCPFSGSNFNLDSLLTCVCVVLCGSTNFVWCGAHIIYFISWSLTLKNVFSLIYLLYKNMYRESTLAQCIECEVPFCEICVF
jgi:hypothetical protein